LDDLKIFPFISIESLHRNMTVFYAPDAAFSNVLPETESQHAVKVLRLKQGDKIMVVDGHGGCFLAAITLPEVRHCEFEILEILPDAGNMNYHLHIAIAPTKNIERFEWFIEKSTEIGVHEITPIICRFSERKNINPERLKKIIVSAAKQSVKANFPILHPPCSYEEAIKKISAEQKFIAHCYDEAETSTFSRIREKKLLNNLVSKSSITTIFIGPEGDFSPEEIEKAFEEGFEPVSLGNSRLRTETAGMIACATVAFVNQ
jgi:16S rRNA (uracil1498-N3)-methyltransferase